MSEASEVFRIFEPVEPVMVGPFLLQGMFEMRQPEVARGGVRIQASGV